MTSSVLDFWVIFVVFRLLAWSSVVSLLALVPPSRRNVRRLAPSLRINQNRFFFPTELIHAECCPSSHHHREIFIHQINPNWLFSTCFMQGKPPQVPPFIPPSSRDLHLSLRFNQNCLFPTNFIQEKHPHLLSSSRDGRALTPLSILTKIILFSTSFMQVEHPHALSFIPPSSFLRINQKSLFSTSFTQGKPLWLPSSSRCHQELLKYCPIS